MTPITLYADPTTHRLLTSASGGAAPSDATFVTLSTNVTLTNERVLTGTSNQVTITDNGAGSTVVLSLPQSIATSSTPSFASLSLTSGSSLTLGTSSSATGGIIFKNATNANTATIISGVTSASYSVTWPTAQGAASTFLQNNGSGVLSWASAGTGDVTAASNLTDNAVVRGDGGAKGVQTSGVVIDDTDNVTGMASLTLTNTGLHLLDTNASHDLIIVPGSDLTADRNFTVTTGDAARTLSMSGNITVAADLVTSGANSLTLTTTGATNVTLPTSGTLVKAVTTANGVSASNSGGDLTFTLGAITPTTVNGLTITSSTGTLTITNGKTVSFAKTLSFDGTDSTTMTFPTTSASIARTDAGQTFTGVQVMTSPTITTSLTTGSSTFGLLEATATTINFAGASGAVVNLGGGANAAELRFLEPSGSGTNYSAIKAQAQGANITYTLPSAVGAAGTFLTDAAGNGTLSWAAAGGGTPRFIVASNCEDIGTDGNKFSKNVGGSGTTVNGSGGFVINTGSTDGSQAAVHCNFANNTSPSESLWDDSPEFQVVAKLTTDTSTNYISYVSCLNDATQPNSSAALVKKHIAFIADATALYASNADGTTQTLSADIVSGVTLTAVNVWRAVQSGSTNVKFYVNKTLKSTSTTNLPAGALDAQAKTWTVMLDNDPGVTTDRTANVSSATVAWNAE